MDSRVTINRLPRGVTLLHTDATGSAPRDAFGPFRVLHQVDAGTLGPVIRAFDPDHDRLVAVKLFRLDVPPERLHQLVAEFERLIAGGLAHPGIAAPLATGTDGLVVYLAQEYVAADSLDVVLRDKQLPPADAVRVAAELASAMDFAAAVKVDHGALHVRDVLISSEQTRLTGLGVTRAIERVGVTAPVRRPYTAPERMAGAAWGRRADIFSLAALVHEMLWGRRLTAIGAQAGETLTELPGGDLPSLRSVFARALAEDPGDRFDRALDFAVALKDAFPTVGISHQSPVTGRPSSVTSRQPPSTSGRSRRQSGLSTDRRRLKPGDLPLTTDVDLPLTPDVDSSLTTDVNLPLTPDDLRVTPDDSREVREVAAAEIVQAFRLAQTDAGATADLEVRTTSEGSDDLEHRSAVEAAPDDEVKAALTTDDSRLTTDDSRLATDDLRLATDPPARSAMWWAAPALIVGLVLGFGGGYAVGSRPRPAAAVASVPTDTAPAPGSRVAAAPSGRDWTESAVSETSSGRVRLQPDNSGETSSGSVRLQPDNSASGAVGLKQAGRAATVRLTPDTTADQAAGRLLVRSTPAGARVFVDGQEHGRTPVAVRHLTRGAHRVRVLRDGFLTEERSVTITSARPAQSLTIALARSRAAAAGGRPSTSVATPGTTRALPGALSVDSRPSGANVFIDEKLAGTTPISLAEVAAGTHAVRLEREGYRRWSSSVRVTAGERNRVTASLEKN